MKVAKAGIVDSYKVHKMFLEWAQDAGVYKPTNEEAYKMWLLRLTDEHSFYLLLTHGRQLAGMLWGRVLEDEPSRTLRWEGIFVRRKFRGRYRFSREVVETKKKCEEGFGRVQMLLPPSAGTIKKKHKVIATLVEG